MIKTAGLPNIQLINDEPWIELEDKTMLKSWDKSAEILYNQQNRQAYKQQFYQFIFDYLTHSDITGDYHEYGCHKARTFRMALTEAKKHNITNMDFYAFDSFEGLPETDKTIKNWKKGALTTSEEDFYQYINKHGLYCDQVKTIKGFYQDSLSRDLQLQFINNNKKITLATIDCDLYTSSVNVFQFIEPLLQEGCVLYLDDLFSGHQGSPFQGMLKAFIEFEKNSHWGFIHHLNVGWAGRSYIVYDKRKEFEVPHWI